MPGTTGLEMSLDQGIPHKEWTGSQLGEAGVRIATVRSLVSLGNKVYPMAERILNFECADLGMGRGATLGIWVLPLSVGPWTSLLTPLGLNFHF